MVSSWHKFIRLPGVQRKLLLQAFLVLPLIHVALRCIGFKSLCATLARLVPDDVVEAGAGPADASQQAQITFGLVEIAAWRVPLRLTCLPRSLTTWWLLRRQGIPGQLRIGTRMAGDKLEAHAWVESSELVLNASPDGQHRYQAFARSLLPAEERLR